MKMFTGKLIFLINSKNVYEKADFQSKGMPGRRFKGARRDFVNRKNVSVDCVISLSHGVLLPFSECVDVIT